MPSTIIKQKIIDAFKSRLQGINGALPYYSSIGAKVSEWKVNPFGANRVDGIDIREGKDEIEQDAEDRSVEWHTLQIEIRIITKNPISASIAREYEQDVRTAIGVDPTFGQLLNNCAHSSTELEKDQENDVVIGTMIEVEVLYVTAAFAES